jgi:hypothetical protein
MATNWRAPAKNYFRLRRLLLLINEVDAGNLQGISSGGPVLVRGADP